MGLQDILGRRRSENRIRRRMLSANKARVDTEEELDATFNRIGNRAYKVGERVFNVTQARKQEGKQILTSSISYGVRSAMRFVTGGPTHKKSKTKRVRRRTL